MTTPKVEYRLTFASGLSLDQATNLRVRIAVILEQANFGALTIQFSSEGGSTDQSLALYNYISSLPVPVRMHAIGHVGSASIPVFLAGHRRTSAPFARFFFHEYDWNFNPNQTLRRIDEAAQRLRNDIELARQIIQTRTKATADILKALDGTAAPTILRPEQAMALGFVDEVCELGQTGTDGMQVAIWTAG